VKFYILEGNNGATYILNVEDQKALDISLYFYKARSTKQKLMKWILKAYLLYYVKKFRSSSLRSINDIDTYLQNVTGRPIDFNIDESCSALVSPTRDKFIVHHHGEYFQKFAFGKSYANVKNEALIYELLKKPKKHFEISKMYDLEDVDREYCTFKLSSKREQKSGEVDLVAALVEFFGAVEHKEVLFSEYMQSLIDRLCESELLSEEVEQCLTGMLLWNQNVKVKLGLVHRDFKPWNVIEDGGLLIYDFEEAVTDGLPMEDLLNFYIDPIIRYEAPEKVAKVIFSEENVSRCERYLDMLGTETGFEPLVYAYLIERVLFWAQAGEMETVERYRSLIKYLCQREHREA